MALAPRASLRSVVLLLSHGKPRLSSLFSSAPKATPGNGAPAARGGDAPVAPAVQPPPAPGQGSGSTCPQERVLHNKHTEDWTPETLNHKRSPKKHHHRSHKVYEDPDAGVPKGSSFSSSLDKPKHGTTEPIGRARIDGGAVGKPSAYAPHKDHKHTVLGASCSTSHKVPEESSSLDKPKHGTTEPTGRARIDGGAVGKPSAYAPHKDRKHSVPGASCSTSHKVPEESSSLDKPKHPTPEPTGRARIHGGAVGKPSAYAPQKDHKHSVPGASCSTSHKVPEESSSLDKPKHGTPEPTGRARIDGGAVGKPSAYAPHKDHKHSVPGASCSTSHKVPEESSSLDKPKHPTPEPTGRARIHGAVGKPSAYAPQKDHKHSVPGGSCSTSHPLPDKVPKEHSEDHKGREDHVARGTRMSSRDDPGHGVPEP